MSTSDSTSTNIADFVVPMVNATTSPNDNNSKVKKTRNRIPLSCEACRKRKMKCDKKRPCSTCTKNGTISQCKYSILTTTQSNGSSENLITPNLKLQLSNDTIRLKMRINKLENLLTKNNIDFNTITSDDVLMSNTLMEGADEEDIDTSHRDPMIELTDKFDLLIIKENKILHGGTTSYMTVVDNDPHLFSMFRGFFAQHKAQFNMFQKHVKSKLTDIPGANVHSSMFVEHSLCSTNYREPAAFFSTLKDTPFEKAVHRINQLLPPMKHLKVLIDNFFEKAYYLVPYVDETTFRQDLEYILYSNEANTNNPSAGGSDAFIHVNHPSNTTVVAILLIILRFSYLSIDVKGYDESPSLIDNPDIVALLKDGVSIGPIYIEYAKLLLSNRPNEYNIWKKVELNNIQALLLLRLYVSFAPEDGGENQDTVILLSIIVQMCKILGLYRDPDRFASVVSNPNDRIIWRRIFYKVLNLDAINSLNSGFPLIYADDEWDTKLPSLQKKDKDILESFKKGNTIDIPPTELKKIIRESAVTQDIQLEYEVTKILRKSMKICNKINSRHKRSEYDALIKETEDFLKYKVNSIHGLISRKVQFDPIYTIFKIPRLKEIELRLELMQLLYILNYLMFLVLELEKNDTNLTEKERAYNEEVLNVYMYKTTEVTFQLFKIGYDFTSFLTETEAIDGETPSHKNLKTFFNGFQQLFESKMSAAIIKCLLFMFSIFLRHHFDNFSITMLIKQFSNCSESLEVLQWLNVSIKDIETNNEVDADKQVFVLLFHYLKSFYMKAFSLKNEFYGCWRGAMLTKLFINYFKLEHPDRFRDLIKSFEVNKMSIQTFHLSDEIPKAASSTSNSSSGGGSTNNSDMSTPYDYRSKNSVPHTDSSSISANNISVGNNSSSVSPNDSNDSPDSNLSSNPLNNQNHLNTQRSSTTNISSNFSTGGNYGMDSNGNQVALGRSNYDKYMNSHPELSIQQDEMMYSQYDATPAGLGDSSDLGLGMNMMGSSTTPGGAVSEIQKEFLEFSSNEIDTILYPDSSKLYDSAFKEMTSRSGPYNGRQFFDFEDQFSSMYDDIVNYTVTTAPGEMKNSSNSVPLTQESQAKAGSTIKNVATIIAGAQAPQQQQQQQQPQGIPEVDNLTGSKVDDMNLPSPFDYGFLSYAEQQHR